MADPSCLGPVVAPLSTRHGVCLPESVLATVGPKKSLSSAPPCVTHLMAVVSRDSRRAWGSLPVRPAAHCHCEGRTAPLMHQVVEH